MFGYTVEFLQSGTSRTRQVLDYPVSNSTCTDKISYMQFCLT